MLAVCLETKPLNFLLTYEQTYPSWCCVYSSLACSELCGRSGCFRSGKCPSEHYLHLLRQPRYRGPELLRSDAGRNAPHRPSGRSGAAFHQCLRRLRHQAAVVALPEEAAPDSRNHLPELLGAGHVDREYVIEQNRQNTLAILCGEWKYLKPSDRQSYEYRNSPRPQLFRISKDPCERHDVAEQYPGIVEELAAKLNAMKSGRE